MDKKTYTYYIDGGHGWLEVPIAELTELGFVPTRYSYRTQFFAYLEEDCDMPAFLDTAPAGIVELDERYDGAYAPIRRYPQFNTPEGASTYDRLRKERVGAEEA